MTMEKARQQATKDFPSYTWSGPIRKIGYSWIIWTDKTIQGALAIIGLNKNTLYLYETSKRK